MPVLRGSSQAILSVWCICRQNVGVLVATGGVEWGELLRGLQDQRQFVQHGDTSLRDEEQPENTATEAVLSVIQGQVRGSTVQSHELRQSDGFAQVEERPCSAGVLVLVVDMEEEGGP
jgi:hypothetical protein